MEGPFELANGVGDDRKNLDFESQRRRAWFS